MINIDQRGGGKETILEKPFLLVIERIKWVLRQKGLVV